MRSSSASPALAPETLLPLTPVGALSVEEAAERTTALSWRRDRGFQVLLLGMLVLGLVYNFAVMIGFGADEPRHMAYVRLLLNEHTLPRLLPDGTEYKGAHTLHPPLYYAALVPFYAAFQWLPGESEWHVVRLVSLALCAGALFLGRDIALCAAGSVPVEEAKRFALLALCSIALLPIWGMTAGTVNNDSAMLLAVTWFLWLLCVRYPQDESWRAALVLGLALGIGGLCKATALICDGGALLAYLIAQRGFKGALLSARTWARLGLILAVGALVCGWWYWHNHQLYGSFTPIARGYAPFAPRYGWIPDPARYGYLTTILHPNFLPLLGTALWGVFYSMWSQKDWVPAALQTPLYPALALWLVVAVLGALVGRSKSRARSVEHSATALTDPELVTQPNLAITARIALWSAGVALLLNWAACITFAMFVHWGWFEGGRYLLSSLWGLGLLVACGWRGWLGGKAGSSARLGLVTLAWSIAILAVNAVTIAQLVLVLNPKYGPGAQP